MKQKVLRRQWAGCSDFSERKKQAKANHEAFLLSDLKKKLDSAWQVAKTTIKHKRPRIKQEETKIVMVFDQPVKVTLREYKEHYTLEFPKHV